MMSQVLTPQKVSKVVGAASLSSTATATKLTTTPTTTTEEGAASTKGATTRTGKGIERTNMRAKTTPMPMPTPPPTASGDIAATKSIKQQQQQQFYEKSSSSQSPLPLRNYDFEDFNTTSSIIEFLNQEQDCCTDADPDSIFEEVSRLTDSNDMRTVDELLLEAERLIQQQMYLGGGNSGDGGADLEIESNRSYSQVQGNANLGKHSQQSSNNNNNNNNIKMNSHFTRRIENVSQPLTNANHNGSSQSKHTNGQESQPHLSPRASSSASLVNATTSAPATPKALNTPTPTGTGIDGIDGCSTSSNFGIFIDNLPSVSVISEESTPRDLLNFTANERGLNNEDDEDNTTMSHSNLMDNTDDDEDTMEEITEAIEIHELPHDGANATQQQTMTTTTKTTAKSGAKATTPLTITTTTTAEAMTETLSVHSRQQQQEQEATITRATRIRTATSSSSSSLSLLSPPPSGGTATCARVGTDTFGRSATSETTKQQEEQHAPKVLTSILKTGTRTEAGAGATIPLHDFVSPARRRQPLNDNNYSTIKSDARRRSSMTTPAEIVSASNNASDDLAYSNTLPRSAAPSKQRLQQLHQQEEEEQQEQEQKLLKQKMMMAGCGGSGTSVAASIYRQAANMPIKPMAMFSDKSVGSSPKHLVSTLSSPIEQIVLATSITREHTLKQEIEVLQEKLKDTEERLESVRIQHDTMSQMQRALRETNTRLQEESEMLKLDVQHLNECANVLRAELKAARHDRLDALEIQKSLRSELAESKKERKRAQEQKDKDGKIILDLQRQCREMERILVRKYPDSVSALIVAAKHPAGLSPINGEEFLSSRKLLEQRIAQLESDAKEQDHKAQQILANVQARFNTVQSKYETHIADLETQVLSLQEINTKLNAQIESQVRTMDQILLKRSERFYNNCTQTENVMPNMSTTGTQTQDIRNMDDDVIDGVNGDNNKSSNRAGGGGGGALNNGRSTQSPNMRDHGTNTIGCPSANVLCHQTHNPHHHGGHHHHHLSTASSSTSSTANSTPNSSRPNSKQSGGIRRFAGGTCNMQLSSKLPVSQSDSKLSLIGAQSCGGTQSTGQQTHNKEDSQLLASVRHMRVDLAIKNKAMQRLTRELEECKKTIKKLQREKDIIDSGPAKKVNTAAGKGANGGGNQQKNYQNYHPYVPATTESHALREAQNKYRLLEADYKTLHDKRLHDLKTLQSAHDRELASCNETVRALQQRLTERGTDEAQLRRKVPGDYYALKAKVSLLERRHSEREERLHMLVEALSKGRLNGALEDLLQDNNNK